MPHAADSDALRADLEKGLERLGLPLEPAVVTNLLGYLERLARWNRAFNLTAVRDPRQMVTRHLLDSLAVLPLLRGRRILDVGTGPGLPGIPLALARPDAEFVLLDSNGKKTRFLRQVVAELGIGNVSVVHSRLEQYQPTGLFETITARAFSSLAELVGGTGHLLAPGGAILALKGAYPEAELAELPTGFGSVEVVPMTVPDLEAARHVVIITRGAAREAEESNG